MNETEINPANQMESRIDSDVLLAKELNTDRDPEKEKAGANKSINLSSEMLDSNINIKLIPDKGDLGNLHDIKNDDDSETFSPSTTLKLEGENTEIPTNHGEISICDEQSHLLKEASVSQINYEKETISSITRENEIEAPLSQEANISFNNQEEFEEIDAEIDDALNEGYMEMECTLERGFSLNESALKKDPWFNKYKEISSSYVQRKFPQKYYSSLKHLIPIRKGPKNREEIKIDKAGLLSFLSFTWMTDLMWKAYKKGLTEEDVPLCSKFEMCLPNTQRLSSYWEEEVELKGIKNASLNKPVWRFIKTRIILALVILTTCVIFGFLGPTFFMRYLIDWLTTDEPITIGITWSICLVVCEGMRVILFGVVWGLNYRTAIRLRAACLGLVFKKLVKVSHLGNKGIGEVINLFANDGQRIFDFITLGTFFISGPLVAIGGIVYILLILGPWALLGMTSFLIFYPCQYVVSRLSGHLRRKTVAVTDQRVRLMSEILTCIKLIKMYAWEKSFAKGVAEIRKLERQYLEKAAYVQSFSLAMTPTVPVLAAIITFLAHIGAGNDLSPAQGFSILSLFFGHIRRSLAVVSYSATITIQFMVTLGRLQAFSVVLFLLSQMRVSLNMMRYSILAIVEYQETQKRLQAFSLIGVLVRVRGQLHYVPYSILSLMEYQTTLGRMKSLLTMKEMEKYVDNVCEGDSCISLKDATFAYHFEEDIEGTKNPVNKENVLKNKWDKDIEICQEFLDQKQYHSTSVVILQDLNIEMKKNRPGSMANPHVGRVTSPQRPHSAADGELVGVCGSVGAGKSSLLLGILGQMALLKGKVAMSGESAYVGQEAWMLNATLRENILLGEDFDAKRYYKVIYACSLAEDVALLPGGDNTEIGERGINLSGGQKQRVSLARALYANKNIYFLDDCLSAVDAHVGQHMFQWVFKTALKYKTVLFVTHQLQYLPECDRIIYLREGRIAEMGTHSQLMAADNNYSVLYRKHMDTINKEKMECKKSPVQDSGSFQNPEIRIHSSAKYATVQIMNARSNLNKGDGAILTVPEENERGSIPCTVYLKYISFCGGFVVMIAVIFTFFINAASVGFSSWWLSVWLNAGSGNTTVVGNETTISTNIGDNPDIDYYRNIYVLSMGFILVTSLIRGFFFMKTTISASSKMHSAVFDKVLRAPMSFFETTPSGRVINIFARDIDEADVRLPMTMETFLQNIWIIFISLLFVCLIFPHFLIILVFIAALFLFIRHIFKHGVRDLKRFENTSRSPMFTYINTTVNGLHSIHAFHKQKMFTQRFMKLFDDNSCTFYLFNAAVRWLAIRLDLIALLISSVTSFFCVFFRHSVGVASAGLALAYAYQLSGIFQYTVRLSTETEARFTSIQRVVNYIETLESEAPLVIKANRPNKNWPKFGRVSFKKVEFKYRPDLPLALKGISFEIDSQENIGVIGRTGSGKSSLGAALFRLVELKRGSIFIDGINIGNVGLEDLRSRLSIIPQDPVLFLGTVRYNLDPFEYHSDLEIREALKKVHMKDNISGLELNLSALVTENGSNFSVGERQLLCMARAILRKSKILFLDEATAGIDTETDAKIQSTLKEAFKDCTMITVAHRLNTIMNCSRVVVMDNGSIAEFDSPEILRQNPASRFSKLIAASKKGFYSI